MLDQEAFARVIASQHQSTDATPADQPNIVSEDDDEQIEVEDVTYRPSNVPMDNADPVWALRMSCLPVLDILVSTS